MKINIDEIICINLKALNAQQLFAICETYFIGFELLFETKIDAETTMYWININDKNPVAFVTNGFFEINSRFPNISMADQEKLKAMKPIKTPKMPKTITALNNYRAFLAEGYDIRTPSMDSVLAVIEATKQREIEIVKLRESLPVVLEMDTILEKIGKYGIDSITKEEKIFLDNLNK